MKLGLQVTEEEEDNGVFLLMDSEHWRVSVYVREGSAYGYLDVYFDFHSVFSIRLSRDPDGPWIEPRPCQGALGLMVLRYLMHEVPEFNQKWLNEFADRRAKDKM